MEELDPAILCRLRILAREGETASQMLREITRHLAPEKPHKVTLIKYMRAAFSLTLQQTSPIAGWSAGGPAELQDSELDKFVMPEIMKNRQEWGSLDPAPSV
jgi:hypothetical protein